MVQGVLHDPQCSIFSKAINDFLQCSYVFLYRAREEIRSRLRQLAHQTVDTKYPAVHKHVIPWELWYCRMCWSFEICSTNSIAACQQGGHGISLEAYTGIMVLSAEDGVGVTPRKFLHKQFLSQKTLQTVPFQAM